jgi:hypothetical protein
MKICSTSLATVTSLVLGAVSLSHGLLVSQRLTSSFRAGSCSPLWARRPFITGNWKLNPSTKDEAMTLAKGIAASVSEKSPCDVALFVPFPFIECVQEAVGGRLIVGAEVRCY